MVNWVISSPDVISVPEKTGKKKLNPLSKLGTVVFILKVFCLNYSSPTLFILLQLLVHNVSEFCCGLSINCPCIIIRCKAFWEFYCTCQPCEFLQWTGKSAFWLEKPSSVVFASFCRLILLPWLISSYQWFHNHLQNSWIFKNWLLWASPNWLQHIPKRNMKPVCQQIDTGPYVKLGRVCTDSTLTLTAKSLWTRPLFDSKFLTSATT